jgi:hypothetical protein
MIKNRLNNPGDLTRLAQSIDKDKGYLSRVLNGQKPLSKKTKTALIEELKQSKIIPFPG